MSMGGCKRRYGGGETNMSRGEEDKVDETSERKDSGTETTNETDLTGQSSSHVERVESMKTSLKWKGLRVRENGGDR